MVKKKLCKFGEVADGDLAAKSRETNHARRMNYFYEDTDTHSEPSRDGNAIPGGWHRSTSEPLTRQAYRKLELTELTESQRVFPVYDPNRIPIIKSSSCVSDPVTNKGISQPDDATTERKTVASISQKKRPESIDATTEGKTAASILLKKRPESVDATTERKTAASILLKKRPESVDATTERKTFAPIPREKRPELGSATTTLTTSVPLARSNRSKPAHVFRPSPTAVIPRRIPKLKNIWHGMNGGVMPEYRKCASSRVPYTQPRWPRKPRTRYQDRRLDESATEKSWRTDVAYDALGFMRSRDWASWQPDRLNTRYEFHMKYCPPAPTQTYDTTIVISAEDSLSAALRIRSAQPRPQWTPLSDIPLVLNMANRYRRGGGFLTGARAQEEDLCRRTDLFMALQAAKYPLPEFGALYSFPISILRATQEKSYKYLKTSSCDPSYFPQIGVLSAAAYNSPGVVDDVWRTRMRGKVDNLLLAALASGHRTLILGAWGCGAFNNPPEEVAVIFNQSLSSEKFRGRFKHVVFAMATRQADAHLGPLSRAFLQTFQKKLYRPPAFEDASPSFVSNEVEFPPMRKTTVDTESIHLGRMVKPPHRRQENGDSDLEGGRVYVDQGLPFKNAAIAVKAFFANFT